MEQNEGKGSIQVIERMMSLLDVLADTPEPATLKALSQATGLHPSTAHRILSVMTHARLVERRDASTYALGIRLLELGSIVKARINLREVALPFMKRLQELVGEVINLGVRDEDDIIYIERTTGRRSLVRVVNQVGGRAPLYLTSLGKLFLATDTAADLHAYAKRTGLPGKTAHSLTDLAALENELAIVRKEDIAYDNEEAEIGLRCVAAPVRNDEGLVVAGLSLSAPTDRHNPEWVACIKKTADELSRALGYNPALMR